MSLVRQSLYDVDGGGADVLPHPGRVGEMKWIFIILAQNHGGRL